MCILHLWLLFLLQSKFFFVKIANSDIGHLAQLVRAPRLHRGGRGFESLGAHQPPKNSALKAHPKICKYFGEEEKITKF